MGVHIPIEGKISQGCSPTIIFPPRIGIDTLYFYHSIPLNTVLALVTDKASL